MKTRQRVPGILRTGFVVALALLVIALPLGPAGQASADGKNILIYYDGHMHTVRSDGSGSVADIKATALSRGLSAVVITDHCTGLTLAEWQSLVAETAAESDANFLALPGFEITGSDGIFNRAHVNALGAADPFVGDDSLELCPEEVWPNPVNPEGTGPLYPENITKWVDYVQSQGGIAVHNHPSGTTRLSYGVTHMEVYNQSHVDDVKGYAAALGYPPAQAWQLGLTLNDFALYGERDVNMPVMLPGIPAPMPLRQALWYATKYFIPPNIGQWLGSPEAPLNSWDQLLMAYVNGQVDKPIFGLANSDAHNTGAANSDVGVAKNGVYLKKLTAPELYKAIREGRTFGTTGPSLDFDVNGKLMGERAITRGPARIHVKANSESASAVLVKIDVIKNGVVWQTVSPMSATYDATLVDDAVTQNGYYRIEITAFDPGTGQYTFAWSNPVFVKFAGPPS